MVHCVQSNSNRYLLELNQSQSLNHWATAAPKAEVLKQIELILQLWLNVMEMCCLSLFV